MKHSLVLANVAWLLVAPAIASPCRAQGTLSSMTRTVTAVDSTPVQPSADSARASAQTNIDATIGATLTFATLTATPTGAGELIRYRPSVQSLFSERATVPGSTLRQPSATSGRVPADVDFLRGGTWKQLYSDVVEDQTTVLRYSLQVARGHHWQPVLAVAAATAGLIVLDPHDTPAFRRTTAFHGFNTVASGRNTGVAMALVPAAFYMVSAKRSDSYGKQTMFLAAQAIADAQIMTFAVKMIDRRIRPSDVRDDRYADTWFKAGVFEGKSFPSGHTMTAFALADVFTERYNAHRWVPWVAYGLAGVVGFSRLTLQSHFPSDIFAGGVLGVVIPHDLVLHR
jgi:membrane-associated phospholipid phosphatase